jgi:hypothetical protein
MAISVALNAVRVWYDARSYASDMPMIGPQNAITLQSSKPKARSRHENFFAQPCAAGFAALLSANACWRVRTVSAQRRVRVVRDTPNACIEAINAIKLRETI